MSATLKQLLDACKKVNERFRHTFNGETWDIWFYESDYPNIQAISTSNLADTLKGELTEYLVRFKQEQKRLHNKVEWLSKLLEQG
jgi:hypothetical protein